MRVFVLTTGRSGSLTFARACGHATNYTAGHESRIADTRRRLDFPDQHIEVDSRLAWMLGSLQQAHPDARYIHLTRDPTAIAASFASRSPDGWSTARRIKEVPWVVRGYHRASLIGAFQHGILFTHDPRSSGEVLATARLMVETITANVTEFLVGKPHLTVDISEGATRIGEVWNWIGAEGDVDAARAEFAVMHNASPSRGQ